MRKTTLCCGIIVVMLFAFSGCDPKIKVSGDLDKFVPRSSFIFIGKILVMHSTLTDEDSTSNLAIVEVQRVIDAPENMKAFEKQQVTVRLLKPETVKEGAELLIYSEPYWFGESIGVEEIASYTPETDMYKTADLEKQIVLQRQKIQNSTITGLLKSSDLVISGKVLKIVDLPMDGMMVTEHNPEWKIAEIQVSEVLKGTTADKTIQVMFASGKDVMYIDSPKLMEGDDGIFMAQPPDKTLPKLLRENKLLVSPGSYMKGMENLSRVKELLKK